jgi:hypothetical protein
MTGTPPPTPNPVTPVLAKTWIRLRGFCTAILNPDQKIAVLGLIFLIRRSDTDADKFTVPSPLDESRGCTPEKGLTPPRMHGPGGSKLVTRPAIHLRSCPCREGRKLIAHLQNPVLRANGPRNSLTLVSWIGNYSIFHAQRNQSISVLDN